MVLRCFKAKGALIGTLKGLDILAFGLYLAMPCISSSSWIYTPKSKLEVEDTSCPTRFPYIKPSLTSTS